MRTRSVLAALAAVVLAPAPVSACDCLALAPLSATVRSEADAVFAGRVVEVTERTEHRTTLRPDGAETSVRPLDKWAVVAVSRVWRGAAAKTVRVHVDGSDCAYPFEPGGAYLVFATRRNGVLWGSRCSRTTALETAEDVLRALGPPRRP